MIVNKSEIIFYYYNMCDLDIVHSKVGWENGREREYIVYMETVLATTTQRENLDR